MNFAPSIYNKLHYTNVHNVNIGKTHAKFKHLMNGGTAIKSEYFNEYKKWLDSDVQQHSRDEIINCLVNKQFDKKKVNDKKYIRANKPYFPTAFDRDDSSDDDSSDDSKTEKITINRAVNNDEINAMFVKIDSLDWVEHIKMSLLVSMIDTSDKYELKKIYDVILHVANILFDKFNNFGSFIRLSIEDKYNFLFHVIFKGQTFYFNTIIDPMFALYLLSPGQSGFKFKPVYTTLSRQLARIQRVDQ